MTTQLMHALIILTICAGKYLTTGYFLLQRCIKHHGTTLLVILTKVNLASLWPDIVMARGTSNDWSWDASNYSQQNYQVLLALFCRSTVSKQFRRVNTRWEVEPWTQGMGNPESSHADCRVRSGHVGWERNTSRAPPCNMHVTRVTRMLYFKLS